MRLEGKRAAVLGGGTGWGAAAAERIADEGAELIIVDPLRERADTITAIINGKGGRASAFTADIADATQLAVIARALDKDGRPLDVLVTHYMEMDWTSLEASSVEAFVRVVNYNLVGPAIATKVFLPLLRKSNAGAIVHIGSIDGLHGNPRCVSYSAAKGGLVPLTKLSAFEFAKDNIRVNLIATGQTKQMTEADMPTDGKELGFKGFPGFAYMRQLNDATPLKRDGSMLSWAATVAFLASDEAAHMTGSVMVVDCGRLAITPGTA